MIMMMMIMMTRTLKMTRCQYCVESPMSRPIGIVIDGDGFDHDKDDGDDDDTKP